MSPVVHARANIPRAALLSPTAICRKIRSRDETLRRTSIGEIPTEIQIGESPSQKLYLFYVGSIDDALQKSGIILKE